MKAPKKTPKEIDREIGDFERLCEDNEIAVAALVLIDMNGDLHVINGSYHPSAQPRADRMASVINKAVMVNQGFINGDTDDPA